MRHVSPTLSRLAGTLICTLLISIFSCDQQTKTQQTSASTDSTAQVSDSTDDKTQSGMDAGLENWGTVEVEYASFRVFLNTQDLVKLRFVPYRLEPSERNVRLYCYAQDRSNNQIDRPVFIPSTSETEPDRGQTIGDTAFILTHDELWKIENAEPKSGARMLRFVSKRATFPNCRNCISYEIFKDQSRTNVRLNPSPPGKMIGDTSLIQ